MAEEEAVVEQPQSRRAQVAAYVRDLDPNQVLDWSEQDTVERFLKAIYMEQYAKAFVEARITGQVLVALEEKHVQELGVNVVGDRILIMDYLKILKKHKKDLDRSQAHWTNTTPVPKCAYHESCGSYMKYILCHCCVSITDWRVTGQGIRWRVNRAGINCCGENETQFVDYRFLKDLELREIPRCLCCCVGRELLIFADDKDSTTVRQSVANTSATQLSSEPIIIRHPDVRRAEAAIRNAWAESQLVAD